MPKATCTSETSISFNHTTRHYLRAYCRENLKPHVTQYVSRSSVFSHSNLHETAQSAQQVDYGPGNRRIVVRPSGRAKHISLFQTQTPRLCVFGFLFQLSRHEADHSRLLPTLRMSGATAPLLHTPSWCR